jgi:hypothetical protein
VLKVPSFRNYFVKQKQNAVASKENKAWNKNKAQLTYCYAKYIGICFYFYNTPTIMGDSHKIFKEARTWG